jgi:hypothetical protein
MGNFGVWVKFWDIITSEKAKKKFYRKFAEMKIPTYSGDLLYNLNV